MAEEQRHALIGAIVALQIAQLKILELEQELLVPLPEGDAALAKKFTTLRASLTRAEHAARQKLETK